MGSGNFRGSSPTPVIPGYIASDGNTFVGSSAANPLPVNVVSGNAASAIVAGGAQSPVAVSTASVTLAAASATRIRLWFHNDGPNTAYLNFIGAAVVSTGIPFPIGADLLLDGDDAKLAWNAICNTAESASIRVSMGATV